MTPNVTHNFQSLVEMRKFPWLAKLMCRDDFTLRQRSIETFFLEFDVILIVHLR